MKCIELWLDSALHLTPFPPSRVPKVLVVTKVTMEIEVTEVRRVIEVSLAFKVFLDLL